MPTTLYKVVINKWDGGIRSDKIGNTLHYRGVSCLVLGRRSEDVRDYTQKVEIRSSLVWMIGR